MCATRMKNGPCNLVRHPASLGITFVQSFLGNNGHPMRAVLVGVALVIVAAIGPASTMAVAAHSPAVPIAAAHHSNGSLALGTELAVKVAVSPTSVPRRSKRLARSSSRVAAASPSTSSGVGKVWGSMNIYLLILGIFVLAVALLFMGRRYAFAITGRRSRDATDQFPTPGARVTLDPQPAAGTPVVSDSNGIQAPATFSSYDQSSSDAESPGSEPVSTPPDPAPAPDPQPDRAEPPTERPDWPPRLDLPPLQSTRPPVPAPFAPPETPDTMEPSRARALEMARQWSDIVQDLVRQLDRQEAERGEMLARIARLEQSARAHEALKAVLAGSSGAQLSPDDLRAVQYVMDSLLQDPDHIVVLASVAQHAQQLARVVSDYARIVRAMGEP